MGEIRLRKRVEVDGMGTGFWMNGWGFGKVEEFGKVCWGIGPFCYLI